MDGCASTAPAILQGSNSTTVAEAIRAAGSVAGSTAGSAAVATPPDPTLTPTRAVLLSPFSVSEEEEGGRFSFSLSSLFLQDGRLARQRVGRPQGRARRNKLCLLLRQHRKKVSDLDMWLTGQLAVPNMFFLSNSFCVLN